VTKGRTKRAVDKHKVKLRYLSETEEGRCVRLMATTPVEGRYAVHALRRCGQRPCATKKVPRAVLTKKRGEVM
jgi:hypothetical protein